MENMVDIFSGFYKGKKVLVTGHTGFKGSWLSIWLHELGAEVIGLALDPISERDNYVLSGVGEKIEQDLRGDIRDVEKVKAIFNCYQPEIVFHLAAQSLVRQSYDSPVDTYEINVMGTIHVLEAIRSTESVKVAIMVTTDKCYENKEQIWGYRENEPMGGYDPYSSSKGAAEIAIASWRRSYFNPSKYEKHGKSIASVRAGNVIGGEIGQKIELSLIVLRHWRRVCRSKYGIRKRFVHGSMCWNHWGGICYWLKKCGMRLRNTVKDGISVPIKNLLQRFGI